MKWLEQILNKEVSFIVEQSNFKSFNGKPMFVLTWKTSINGKEYSHSINAEYWKSFVPEIKKVEIEELIKKLCQ